VAPEAGITEAATLLSSAVLESDSPAVRP